MADGGGAVSGQDGSGTYRSSTGPLGPGEQMPHAFLHTVGGDFFTTLEIPLRAGRVFNDGDTATAPRVVVIDEFLARSGVSPVGPIGRQLNFGSPRNYTIVGVVGTDQRRRSRAPGAGGAGLLQRHAGRAVDHGDRREDVGRARVTRRAAARRGSGRRSGAGDLGRALAGRLARAFAAAAPDAGGAARAVRHGRAHPLCDRHLRGPVVRRRARLREFAIRQALGADRASILSLVLAQGLRTTAAGLTLGLGGALVLTRYLQSLLFGVSARDATVFAAATVVLGAVALLACYIPARRATRVDPMAALRNA